MRLLTFERCSPGVGPRGGQAEHSMSDLGLGFEDFEPTTPGSHRLGALIQLGPNAGAVVDLNRALAVKLVGEDVGAPEAEADSLVPPDMLAFLQGGARSLAAAHAAFGFAADALERYDAPDLRRTGVVEERGQLRLCAPLPRPGKIVGAAGNYPAHATEGGGAAPPREPVFFLKAPSAVIGPDDEIVLPPASEQVDYGGELAAVIGRPARNVSPEEALEYVAGYCAANDVTARDLQSERGQHFIGKSCDTFAPLGPVLTTVDEIPDPSDLGIRTTVSGELRQSARGKEMIFPLPELLAFASHLMTLEPGDVLLTGTPAGVGAAQKPPCWLREGDVVEVAIENIGALRNYVRR
jgi:acylpyruvate hydrolase